MKNDATFGLAHVKTEGSCVRYDKDEEDSSPIVEYTWLEVHVPKEHLAYLTRYIYDYLHVHGYDE